MDTLVSTAVPFLECPQQSSKRLRSQRALGLASAYLWCDTLRVRGWGQGVSCWDRGLLIDKQGVSCWDRGLLIAKHGVSCWDRGELLISKVLVVGTGGAY